MTLRRIAAALLVVSLFAASALSCGKYGPPERPGREAPEESK